MSEQQQLSNEPKFYKGGKSKALRALKGFGEHAVTAADKLLFANAENGAWGFYPLDAQAAQDAGNRKAMEEMNKLVDTASTEESQPIVDPLAGIDHNTGEPILQDALPAGPTNEDSVESEPEAEEPDDAEVFGPTLLSQLTSSAAGAPAAPSHSTAAPVARAASRTSYTIEKNRPEQNGIKRPSQGGLCRAVWDACDDLRAQLNNGNREGTLIPDSKQIKAVADAKGWNRNNAMIEFYQWRRFNGITGRSVAAAAPAAPEVADEQAAA